MFWKRTIWSVLFSLMVIAFLAIGGIAVYKAGFAHGAVTEITIPEGSDINIAPPVFSPYGRHFMPFGPRVGLLGIFPFFLCFGGFFFLMMIFGACRRHMFWKYAGKGYPKDWKRRGPGHHWRGHHWGPDFPPWDEDQPESESDDPAADADESEG